MMRWYSNRESMEMALNTPEIKDMEAEISELMGKLMELEALERGQWLISVLSRKSLTVEPEEGTTQRLIGKYAYITQRMSLGGDMLLSLTFHDSYGHQADFQTSDISLHDNGYLRINGGIKYGMLHLNIKDWNSFMKETVL